MCNRSHSINDGYRLLKNILEVRLVLRLTPGPGQPFCHTQLLKETCCKSIYVSHCNTVTGFGANSYYKDHQLNWLGFTSLYLCGSHHFCTNHTDYLPGFVCADTCGKSKRDCAGIRVCRRRKTEEAIRKMEVICVMYHTIFLLLLL